MHKTSSGLIGYVDRKPWLNIGLRTVFALPGGYVLSLLAGAALAAGLPLASRTDAATLAIMLAFTVHAFVILWVFAASTVLRASLGLIVPATLFGVWLQIASTGVAT